MLDGALRIEVLARRVRWLERYRRWLAVLGTVVLAPIPLHALLAELGPEWPEAHATALGAMIGVMTWWVIEVALIGISAWWQTECGQLMRAQGLPTAIAIQRRK